MLETLAACLFAGIGGIAAGDPGAVARPSWWNADWACRAKVTVDSGFYRRENMLVSYDVDFAEWLKKAGLDGAFDGKSPRVTRICDGAQQDVPSRFIPEKEGAAKGTLLWQRPGEVAPMVQETFFIYFDALRGAPKAAPQYPPLEPVRNLLVNADFETPDPKDPTRPAGWEYVLPRQRENGSVEWVNGFGRSGKRCMKLVKNSEDVQLVQQGIKVRAGHEYVLSGWVKGTSSSGGTAIFCAWYSSAQGGPIPAPKGGYYGNYKTMGGCGLTEKEMPWVFVSATGAWLEDLASPQGFRPPGGRLVPGTGSARVQLCTYAGKAGLSFYVADIEFKEAGVGEPPEVHLAAVEKK